MRATGGGKDMSEQEAIHGCGHEQTEPHTCPYAEDVNNDSETLCTCCDACAQECAYDI